MGHPCLTNRNRWLNTKSIATGFGLIVFLSGFSLSESSAAEPVHPKEPAQFGPGVRIDWQQRLVELDAEVVLREGSLELLACSPQTREHESILRVHARPLHVFQAMGLIGLTPGSPVTFDEQSKQWHPPTGDSLLLSVRYATKGTTAEVPVDRWLREAKHGKHPQHPADLSDRMKWVFAGSRTLGQERFGADLDGTVVCVVDFDTALITVSERHTADNEALWLEANTDVIPPVGTRCTLVIRGAPVPAPELRLSADGTLQYDGKVLALADAVKLIAGQETKRDGPAIILTVESGVPKVARRKVLRGLEEAGIERSRIEVRDLPGMALRRP